MEGAPKCFDSRHFINEMLQRHNIKPEVKVIQQRKKVAELLFTALGLGLVGGQFLFERRLGKHDLDQRRACEAEGSIVVLDPPSWPRNSGRHSPASVRASR